MHIEYWECDFCKKVIDYDEKTKYTTPEMGYPFIPKNGGGKHFHYNCLISFYNKKKELSQQQIAELMDDAVRRHDTQISKKIKKGNLTQEKVTRRKATKQDRESLVNYFYDYYGLKVVTKKLNTIIDSLNECRTFGEYQNIQIPYYQLKDMLIYYRKELDKAYANKNKKDGYVNPLSRIFYDIAIVVNNINDYANRRSVVYNQINNNKVDGGETLEDFSIYLQYNKPKKDENSFERIEELKEIAKELGKVE